MNFKKETRRLVFAALLTALSVIIGFVCKAYFTFGAIRVTFDNLPVIMAGILLGPVFGACVGAAADIISALLSGFAVNPLITLGAAAIGLTAGVISRLLPSKKMPSVLASALISHAVGSMLIKSFALWTMGYALATLWVRVPLYVGIGTVEAYFLYVIFKSKHFKNTVADLTEERL